MYDIHDTEKADWVNNCPTHKIEVLYSDECGIQLVVRFHNEPDEDEPKKNPSLAILKLGRTS